MARKRLKSHECPNCGFQFSAAAEHTNFCPQCGQENHNPRHPLLHYGFELIESITHFDSKFLYSLKTLLLKPGKITSDYINNIRGRYSPPVRMFIFISLFSLIVMSMFERFLFMTGSMANFSATDARQNELTISELFDRSADSIKDNILVPPFSWIMRNPEITNKQLRELKKLPPDSIGSWLLANGYSNNSITRFYGKNKYIRIHRKMTVQETSVMVGNIFKSLFLIMVPVLALFYFFVFYSRQRFFYDAMLYAIHLMCFFMTVVAIVMLLVMGLGLLHINSSVLFLPALLAILAYSFIAAKKIYGYSWLLTGLRSLLAWLLVFTSFQLIHNFISNHSGR